MTLEQIRLMAQEMIDKLQDESLAKQLGIQMLWDKILEAAQAEEASKPGEVVDAQATQILDTLNERDSTADKRDAAATAQPAADGEGSHGQQQPG